jgi:hypothetical protein
MLIFNNKHRSRHGIVTKKPHPMLSAALASAVYVVGIHAKFK